MELRAVSGDAFTRNAKAPKRRFLRVRRARFLRSSAATLGNANFGSECSGLRTGAFVRIRRPALLVGCRRRRGGKRFVPRSRPGSQAGLTGQARSDPKRWRPSGRCRGGGSWRGLRHESGAEAAAAGMRGGPGKSPCGGYDRSLVAADRCSAAPVSARVPMPPERPTCPVVSARSLAGSRGVGCGPAGPRRVGFPPARPTPHLLSSPPQPNN